MTARRIAVVTSSRADWGHLVRPLHALRARRELDVRIVATGAHLLPEFGETVAVIESEGFEVAARVPCLEAGDDRAAMGRGIGNAARGFTDALERLRPDLLLVVADRFEMLGPAAAALALGVPVAHLEGGEASEGAIDHLVRNALTALAHVHLVPTELARRRVVAMGEEPWRVHRVGAPSIDQLVHGPRAARADVEARLGHAVDADAIVASWHPVTLDDDPAASVAEFGAALGRIEAQVILCHPNADAGGRAIRDRLRALARTRPRTHFHVNLEPATYWGLLRLVRAVVGNSSSGVMETASIPVPAVDVGTRQAGRERGANVVHAATTADAIVAALAHATSDAFAAQIAGIANPYGDGHASERIAAAIAEAPDRRRLLHKRTWWPPEAMPTWSEP